MILRRSRLQIADIRDAQLVAIYHGQGLYTTREFPAKHFNTIAILTQRVQAYFLLEFLGSLLIGAAHMALLARLSG